MSSVNRLLGQVLRTNTSSGVAYFAVSVAETATGLLIPAALASAVDAALGTGPSRTPMLLLIALLVLATATEAARELLGAATSARAGARLRYRVLGRLLWLDGRERRRFPSGDLLTRLLEGTSGTARLVPVSVGALTSLLSSAGGTVALFLTDYRAGLLVVLGAPPIWWLATGFLRRTGRLTTDYQQVHGRLATRLVDALTGSRTIRALGTTDREVRRVLEPLPELRAHGLRFWLAQRDMGWQLGLLAPVMQVGVLAMAGYGVSVGDLSPGGLIAVSGYLGYAMGIFRQAGLMGQLGAVRGSAARLTDLFDLPSPAPGTAVFPPGGGELRLTGIRVSERDRPVLDGVDLTIPAGQFVAVVGPSGTGKSVLAEVAGGLRRPDRGSVSLDGVELTTAHPDELPEAVAFAFERPVLLGDTVDDALTRRDRPAAPAAVHDALAASASSDFVHRLPERAATPLTGLQLSGGEVQRLGLARAFSANARLLILDDALSSVDMITEARIWRALDNRDGTLVVVAHRLSTAARADRVLWLQDGRVQADGRHTDLMDLPGYRALFELTPQPEAVP